MTFGNLYNISADGSAGFAAMLAKGLPPPSLPKDTSKTFNTMSPRRQDAKTQGKDYLLGYEQMV